LVSSSSRSSSCSRSSTRTIGVAVVATLAVFRAAVPARAFGHFLSELAHLSLCVEHVALGTTKLVWLLVVITGEVVLAVCGMRVDGVGLQQVLGSNGVTTSRTGEAVNLQKFLSIVAHSCKFALCLGTNTGADFHIKDKRIRARELERPSAVALDVLVAHCRVVVVKDSVRFWASWVGIGTWLLDKLTVSTVNVVREDALLVVHPRDVEEQTLGAVLYCGNTVSADVKEIALLRVGELAVIFGADEVIRNVPVLLSVDGDGREEDDGGEVGADHAVAETALAPCLLSLPVKVSDQDVGAAEPGALVCSRKWWWPW